MQTSSVWAIDEQRLPGYKRAMKLILDNASSARGAQMGRPNELPEDAATATPKLNLQRLKWVDGDYDSGGCYWGCPGRGMHVYAAFGEWNGKRIRVYIKTVTRRQAKDGVLSLIPNAKFYR
jgi:hypothetical protein